MSLRKEIAFRLNKPRETSSMYETLKQCLVLDETRKNDIDGIDRFFEGMIKSLFYRANGTGLVLVGRQGIGKSEFFCRLLPQKEWFSYSAYDIYNSWMVDYSDCETSMVNKILSSDGFILTKIRKPYIENNYSLDVNKRLCNLVYTCNELPKGLQNRKSLVILNLKHIDHHTFNSLDKDLLWREIWSWFLRKHNVLDSFSEQELNKYFKE